MAKILNKVRETRAALKKSGLSDLKNSDQISSIRDEIQETITAMNAAKLKAMREAEAPFLIRLAELDEELAIFVTLVA